MKKWQDLLEILIKIVFAIIFLIVEWTVVWERGCILSMSSFLSIGWKIKGWNGRYFNWGWNDILHNVVWKEMGWNPGNDLTCMGRNDRNEVLRMKRIWCKT